MMDKFNIEEMAKIDDEKELQSLSEQLSILTKLQSKWLFVIPIISLCALASVLLWHVLCIPLNIGWIISGILFIWLIKATIQNIRQYIKWNRLLYQINTYALYDEDGEDMFTEMIETLESNPRLPYMYAWYVKRNNK